MALPVSLDRRVQGLLLVAALWDLPLKSILSNRMKSTQQTLRNQLRQQIRKTRANLTETSATTGGRFHYSTKLSH